MDVRSSAAFLKWVTALRDHRAKARIAVRLARLAEGNPDDSKSVGDGVIEMRIDYGPGYRIYYARRGEAICLLLCGGDKSSQPEDVAFAKRLAREWKE